MPANDIRILPGSRSLLGECPLWHPEEQVLYWIDIAGRTVRRFNPSLDLHSEWPLPSEPGCIAWVAGGGLVVAMRSGIALLDTDNGTLHTIADAPYDAARVRFNDGRCDAAGRLWVGTLSDDRSQALGALYCLERGTLRLVGNPVTVSNGVAFSPDSGTLFHTDTTAHRISAYDFDLATGTLSKGHVFKQFSDMRGANYGGRPDGATIDSEGMYWCAMYEGGKLLRLSSQGEILQQIPVPARCPTMPAFGGADLRTLFVTTVSHNRPKAELTEYPQSGCVLTLSLDAPGRIEYAYAP